MRRIKTQVQSSDATGLALTLVSLAIRTSAVGLSTWVGYQLIKQNGRILLQLEEIREQLHTAAPAAIAPEVPQGLPIGTPAPDFDLPNLQGGRLGLRDLQGRSVLAVFFDPTCGFCRQMAGDLAALPVDGSSSRPTPVVITAGDQQQNQAMIDEFGISCPVLLQQGREVAAAYGANGTPTAYIIDSAGRIASELGIGGQGVLALAEGVTGTTRPENGHDQNPEGGPSGRRFRPVTTSNLNRSGLPAGTPAPALRLPTLDGGELNLEDFRGRRVLLVFSDPACGPCNELAPQLEKLHRSRSDLQILMVSRGDVQANREKVEQHRLTFPIALQRHWEASRDYGMFATPVGYLIDEDGVIVADVAAGSEAILALAAQPGGRIAQLARS